MTRVMSGLTSGSTPMSLDSYRPSATGRTVETTVLPSLSAVTLSVAVGPPDANGDLQVLPRRDRVAGDVDNAIAWHEAGLFGRRAGDDRSDQRGLIDVDRDPYTLHGEDERRHDDGEDDVHRRAGEEDLKALPLGLRQELVGLA